VRLAAAEAALQGKPANVAAIAVAAERAASGAKPLPMTGYKLDLLKGVVKDVLERLAA
jgi:xanthine dehydrogenase YagS FAD-binding subunit